MALPLELRENIYSHLLSPASARIPLAEDHTSYRYDLAVLRTCSQVHREADAVFRRLNIFIRISAPWPQAEEHIALIAGVPLVAAGFFAIKFKDHHLYADIDVPLQPVTLDSTNGRISSTLVILLEDLHAFCEMWYHYDLTHTGLNRHFRLTLQLNKPDASYFTKEYLPEMIQERLFLPFGMIKGLQEVRVHGGHSESVVKKMRAAMAVPYTPREECLEQSTKLRDAGDKALQDGRFEEAIDLYIQAFAAMHIRVRGRERMVWADGFFTGTLSGGLYDGKLADEVRWTIRVWLVANIVLAYLKLEECDEARFWGQRSINNIREHRLHLGLPQDEPIRGFEGSDWLGLIYFRTGLAYKALGERETARTLFHVAVAYLPDDLSIKKELGSVALLGE